jgi:hypothetical protein
VLPSAAAAAAGHQGGRRGAGARGATRAGTPAAGDVPNEGLEAQGRHGRDGREDGSAAGTTPRAGTDPVNGIQQFASRGRHYIRLCAECLRDEEHSILPKFVTRRNFAFTQAAHLVVIPRRQTIQQLGGRLKPPEADRPTNSPAESIIQRTTLRNCESSIHRRLHVTVFCVERVTSNPAHVMHMKYIFARPSDHVAAPAQI